MNTSPAAICPALSRKMLRTLSPIEPKCTGTCGAFATNPPVGSKIAQEKSSRSLIFTECAVFASVAPICSAIDINRLLNTSNITGSAFVPKASWRTNAVTRLKIRLPNASHRACQPASTTFVPVDSTMIAGPLITSVRESLARSNNGYGASPPIPDPSPAGGEGRTGNSPTVSPTASDESNSIISVPFAGTKP